MLDGTGGLDPGEAILGWGIPILVCRRGEGWGIVFGLTLRLFSRSLPDEYRVTDDSRLGVC